MGKLGVGWLVEGLTLLYGSYVAFLCLCTLIWSKFKKEVNISQSYPYVDTEKIVGRGRQKKCDRVGGKNKPSGRRTV